MAAAFSPIGHSEDGARDWVGVVSTCTMGLFLGCNGFFYWLARVCAGNIQSHSASAIRLNTDPVSSTVTKYVHFHRDAMTPCLPPLPPNFTQPLYSISPGITVDVRESNLFQALR